MTNTLGIVEVPPLRERPGDSVDSGASLLDRRFGGKSLLEWVVRRVSDSLLLDQVAVVTDVAQAAAVERLAPSNIPVSVCRQPDPLGRFVATVRQFDVSHVVRVPLACPFVDPELIDRLVCTASANPGVEYIGYFSVDGRPAILSKVGLFAEWSSAEALYRADRLAVAAEDRNEPTRYVYSHPEAFQLRFIPVPAKLDRRDVRLIVDDEEDWELAHMIFDALGPESLNWQKIAALLDQQPAIRERMAVLNERNGE